MIHYTFKLLLGLAVVDVVWSMDHDRQLTNSDSSDKTVDRETERTRHRRSAAVEVMTQAERIEFLATHNNIRNDISGFLGHAQPSAAGMMKMYWSAELEASAVSWSMQCKTDLTHGQSDIVKSPAFLSSLSKYGTWIGQNLYRGGAKPKGSLMVKAFANETYFFTFNEGAAGICVPGKMCGHYTQVVWQSSFLVGCGYAQCGDVYIGTCNYLPGGNYKGAAPYKSGSACSLCVSDSKYNFTDCDGRLCVPRDRCSPVKSCTVEDASNCLCSESSYNDIVGRMLVGDGSIHVASPIVVVTWGMILPLVAVLLQGQQGALPGYDSALL